MSTKPFVATAIGFVASAGLLLIQTSEGLRLKPYRDPVGIATVCWGHTGPDVRMGQLWTREQCQAVFYKDVQIAVDGLNACVHVPLNPNQATALVDLTFNMGVRRICSSTLVKKLNAGDYDGAAKEFPRWCYAGTTVLNGLVKRRAAEVKLWNTPITSNVEYVSYDTIRKLAK